MNSPADRRAIVSVQKNDKLLEQVLLKKRGDVDMCAALDRIWEDGRKEGIKEVIGTLLMQGVLTADQADQIAEKLREKVMIQNGGLL